MLEIIIHIMFHGIITEHVLHVRWYKNIDGSLYVGEILRDLCSLLSCETLLRRFRADSVLVDALVWRRAARPCSPPVQSVRHFMHYGLQKRPVRFFLKIVTTLDRNE